MLLADTAHSLYFYYIYSWHQWLSFLPWKHKPDRGLPLQTVPCCAQMNCTANWKRCFTELLCAAFFSKQHLLLKYDTSHLNRFFTPREEKDACGWLRRVNLRLCVACTHVCLPVSCPDWRRKTARESLSAWHPAPEHSWWSKGCLH